MRLLPRLLSLLSILVLSSGAALSAENQIVQKAIDGFVRPAYAKLAETATLLRTDMDELCAAPGDATLMAARDSFDKVVAAWGAVETIRFGPITQGNRLERILYWPDRKSIGLKQVQAAITAEDSTASMPGKLANKSVAMQGLGALEFVLFGTGAEEMAGKVKTYRCGYGLAIAQNVEMMAKDISAEWRAPAGFAHQWSNPDPKNSLYRTDQEAVTELLNVLVHGLEMVRDVRLNGFLGKEPEGDKPKQALFWRSQMTTQSLWSNMDGLKRLFAASGLAASLTGENQYLGGSIDFEFSNAERTLANTAKPVADLLTDPATRSKLSYFRVVTSSLSDLLATRLTAALGLSAGFSSLDGD